VDGIFVKYVIFVIYMMCYICEICDVEAGNINKNKKNALWTLCRELIFAESPTNWALGKE